MGSAAPARKSPQSSGQWESARVPLPEKVKKLGYIALVQTARNVTRQCSALEINVFLEVYFNTIGQDRLDRESGGRPEWCSLSEPELAKLLDVSVEGVHMAINNLKSFRPKVLDTRGRAGVRREFRVIVENFASARKPEPEEETQEDAAKQVRYRGSSYSFTLRRPVRKFNLKATGEAEFSHEETDSDEVNVSIKLIHEPLEKTTGVNGIDLVPGPLEKTTGVPASEATEGNLHPPPVRTAACIPAGSSVGRRDILHDLLEPICRNHGRPLHDAFLGKIVAALDGKSIDAYRAALHAWLSKNSKKSGGWFAAGILLNLAQDVPREKPSRSPANPAPAGSVSEPENSGSLWMQIRQRVRTYVTEATYNNWFTATAFDRFDSQDDELHVCVADIAVKQSLEQEFASEIDRAIKILGLTVRRIVYRISLPGLAMEAVN